MVPCPTGEGIGHKSLLAEAEGDYLSFLEGTMDCDLKGLKVALDCANGASFHVAPEIMRRLGAQVFVINDEPDGTNINEDCGSTHMEGLRKFTLEVGADIGLAFDGDADRVLAVDEKGNYIDGDRIMAVAGIDMKKHGKLYDNTIVTTVMSNLGFDIMAKKEGLNVAKTVVGDRYVLEEMLKHGYSLGGEQSGHVIFLEYNTTGDGLVTGLQLLKAIKTSGKKISELASVMQVLPQVLKNARVKNENKARYMEDEIIAKLCKELEGEFKGEGRVLIRPSGTEPLVRVMIEGRDQEYITFRAVQLARIIEERLG
jgi:phosphoglucosamine mutase